MKGRIFYFSAESQRKGFVIGVGLRGSKFGRRVPAELMPLLMGDSAAKKAKRLRTA
jgi:hypothetical protein